ncbi:MAG: Omp28 family outer membrane lipoprotein [Muribaculaceae bacterium]|nr:Omp28 family outer membrane lipoprotein [Muribaculaceae bacterium]
MKKSSKISMLLAIAAVTLPGCNDIDSEERFIELPPIEGNRVVLLEDYTGQSCPNCPEGHRVIEQLVEQYPGKVVAVSIHAGAFAIPATNPTYVGLKPAFGDAMSADRGVSEYPAGVVDGQGPSLHANWPTAVRDALQVAALCEIEIDGFSYDEATRNLGGTVTVLPGKSASAAIGIWIIEDGIVARQYNVNGDNTWDRNYVHDHVLRSYATNSVWGDPVTLVRDEESSRDFSVILDSTWNVDNISVVAFVTDMATGEYLQTAYAHVNLSNEE